VGKIGDIMKHKLKGPDPKNNGRLMVRMDKTDILKTAKRTGKSINVLAAARLATFGEPDRIDDGWSIYITDGYTVAILED